MIYVESSRGKLHVNGVAETGRQEDADFHRADPPNPEKRRLRRERGLPTRR